MCFICDLERSDLNASSTGINSDGYLMAWTDGSCLRNGQPGAKAAFSVIFSLKSKK